MNVWKRVLKTRLIKLLPKKMRSKFLVVMILLSLPPLFVLGFLSFQNAKSSLLSYNTKTSEVQLATSSEVADLLFRNINNINRYVVMNTLIRDELRHIEAREEGNLNDRRKRLASALQQIINEHSIDTRYINSLCVMDIDYTVYCLGKTDNAGLYEHDNKKSEIERSSWYKQAYDAKGRVTFFSYNVLGDYTNSLSTVKLFRDSESLEGKVLGLLIVNVSKTMFESVFNTVNEKGSFMAVDFTGNASNIVYTGMQFPDLSYAFSTLEQLENYLQSLNYIVSTYRNITTGWTFIHIINKEELLQESNNIASITIVSASIMAIIALIVSFIVSGTITEPLLQLKKMMTDWKQGLEISDIPLKDDEIGALAKTFVSIEKENKNLNIKLYQSKLKEREAELRALQAQIKPHFLYNTLDSIYLMARLNKTDEVAQMALSLSESFKLSLNNGQETIPIFKELAHIEHYMRIQNIRYHSRFNYHVHVEPEIMSLPILKLVLQPLVENAIYHGLETKIGSGDIWLVGKKVGDELYFKIEDNGIGMENIDDTKRGFGINNVKERLQLYYGQSHRFYIESKKNVGTTITIYFKPFSNGGANE